MTEITRVPLPPVAKGALGKLWLGVAAAALSAGGLAYATMPPSVKVDTVTAGTGASPTLADVALINYVGYLPDGKKFDEGKQAVMPLEGVVPGFSQALQKMQKGGKYKVLIPSALAYGAKGAGDTIPPNTDLTFEVELLDFRSREEIEAQQRMMQQLQQQMQQQGASGPGGAPEGAPQP